MIEAKQLSKVVTTSEGELTILHDVSLSIATGNSAAIVGASGSGKSTLLGILAGLDIPTGGEVILNGNHLNQMTEEGRAEVRAKNVGFVFQSFQLLPGLSALENVMMPLELHGVKGAKEKSTVFLERVGLAHRLNHYPKQLSGGEQQRVAVARAFASEPAILFADEPTGNLDSATGLKVIDLIFQLNQELNTTLVLVTHEERLAQRCSQHIELAAGGIVTTAESVLL
ncbi:ABC transporter ATP-binding protein [Aurantivibrio plasticivorans]